ncbi:MAG TPA: CBS domain-containing protein [Candidatus Dormibacteraeota bacterium]|nr:CBS domain-containing protein [Candidatus Dormibacteraeota bacterium]
MKVKDLKLGRLISVEPSTRLGEIARRMRVDDADSVAVMSRGRLVGIVTERDLVRAMADGIDPQEAAAEVVMSIDPATVDPDDDVSVVAVRMMRLGVRHFPVIGEDGKPVGLVSARDLVRGLDRD